MLTLLLITLVEVTNSEGNMNDILGFLLIHVTIIRLGIHDFSVRVIQSRDSRRRSILAS